MTTRIYGFSLIRNGHLFDYPFRESFRTLGNLCERVYIACGASEDETEETVRSLPFAEIIKTKWDLSKRQGGLILSEQTNVALQQLRRDHPQGWGIYLQADEVFSERDYELILEDIERAQAQGCDAIRFRYLHFWERYDQLLIAKRWYPQEIRAIKLDSQVESWGDAQGFRGYQKVYDSEAIVYHYGHVREPSKYELKMQSFYALYHADQDIPKAIAKNKNYGRRSTIAYRGPHPQVMAQRMGPRSYPTVPEVYILLPEKRHLPWSIGAQRVHWISCKKERQKREAPLVDLYRRFFNPSWVPYKMRSPLARPWSEEFRLLLALSKLGIYCH